jgi:rhamnose utilization protein RhaD (predicted bifunctional aldolase and dehydrogenase)/NAD(P)-dependent dehydrogenase (short-subunit alcohol dehydrogenase family)
MKSLWTNKEAKTFSKSELDLRVYTSRLLGRNPELVLHGGGNTSVKGSQKDIFGNKKEVLYIKGSGWDLISIEKQGFAPVELASLKHLSTFNKLSDSEMVKQQKLATLDPNAPNPSVEAILHALIPYKFVDHTHADSVLAITNTPNGRKKIENIYGSDILIIPYVMPGFILAKTIAQMTKEINWNEIKGMILLNHGVFSFGKTAKQSYERMIRIVSQSERYLDKENVWRKYNKGTSKLDIIKLVKIRKKASQLLGKPCIALLNDSLEAVGFSKMSYAKKSVLKGTLTPDHVIRTKPFPWVINDNIDISANNFIKRYDDYFKKNSNKKLTKLNSAPKWALWEGNGIISFSNTLGEAQIISDINKHTIRTIQTSNNLDKWKPISFGNLFEVEYWELEQAKLNKSSIVKEFEGKIALITGAASGIGRACVRKLLDKGCSVVGFDKNKKVESLFKENKNYKGNYCNLLNYSSIKKTIAKAVQEFGGIDILISNAGIFPDSAQLEKIDDKKWNKELDINLGSHHRILRECIPFLKFGIDPSIIFIGSRNVGAPGPGAGTYTVAKAGLTQMSRLAAIELSKFKIRVNIIHPDCVYDTNVWSKKILKSRAKEYGLSIENYKKRNLLKTNVSSSDVAELASFLASSKSIKTTGAQIPVDGGNDRII